MDIVWCLCLVLGSIPCVLSVSIMMPTAQNEEDNSNTGNNGFERVGDAADLDQLLGGIDYLYRYCYLAKEFGFGGEPDVVNIQSAIRKMQQIANIGETDRLDSATLFAMRSPRCGMCDIQGHDPNITIYKKNIKFHLLNYPSLKSLVTPQQVKKDVTKAFALWSEVIPVNFEFTNIRNDTDIAVSFGSRRHGAFQDRTFDGAGGAVAHLFKDEKSGDFRYLQIHFDDDEVFTRQARFGQNLFYDVVHQIGHVLGLGHTDVKESVMWPYQKGFVPGLELSDHDIRSVQKIHGVRQGSELPPLSTTAAPATRAAGPQPILEPVQPALACADAFATAIIKGELHLLQGDRVWVYKLSDLIENTVVTSPIDGYEITKYFRGLHNNQDLAYTNADGSTIFIRGKNYWKFDGTRILPDYPKKISGIYQGVPKNVKAAFHDKEEHITYFFKGDRYWRFSDRKMRLAGTKKGFPLSDEFEGLPADITAAFADENGYRFLLKGQQMWLYRSGSSKLVNGYPRIFPLPNCQ